MQHDTRLGASIGVVVKDLEPVLDLYTEGLGLGPFQSEEIRGAGGRLRVAIAPLGVCEMELIEVIDGRPPHQVFLESRGEGMNHLNLDKCSAEAYLATLSQLYFRGIEPYWGLPFTSFCYVTTEPTGGIDFEVMVGSGHAGKKGHNHLGLVVADTDRTTEFYTGSLGLPAFRTGTFPMPRAFYRDQRIETTFQASFCDLGETQLRLYQVLEGVEPLAQHLASQGEGMHHLSLRVPSVADASADLAGEGIDVLWSCPELGLTLLDTARIGGMTFSLAEA